MEDVVADLHVLQDLRRRGRGGPRDPERPEARSQQQHAAHHGEAPVHLDHARDVAAIAIAEVVVDLVVNGVEALAELFDLLLAQAREWALDLRRGQMHPPRAQSSISMSPSGAFMQVRTVSPSDP